MCINNESSNPLILPSNQINWYFFHQRIDDKLLTLLIAQRLLQHGEDDRIVQDKVAEVASSCGTQSGVANQGVFIQQAAGGGSPAGGREGP